MEKERRKTGDGRVKRRLKMKRKDGRAEEMKA